ncbi:MAG: hypothetical protein FJ284_08265 [Planctomycetes bacterium]|nr:hypothetical protein [Planctomycetota bacterium]MBM4058600.1 hypothetical protein [Planctomycetota bacterium]
MPSTAPIFRPSVTQRFAIKVGDAERVVRAAVVWPIPEVLDLESQFEPGNDATDHRQPDVVAELLDSRMIAPPRPRRRRERAVSSRAVFYAGTED